MVILSGLDVARQLVQLLDGIRLDIIVVEMVEEDVQTLLGIDHMRLELFRCLRLHALHVCVQDVVNWLRACGDVRSITTSCY